MTKQEAFEKDFKDLLEKHNVTDIAIYERYEEGNYEVCVSIGEDNFSLSCINNRVNAS